MILNYSELRKMCPFFSIRMGDIHLDFTLLVTAECLINIFLCCVGLVIFRFCFVLVFFSPIKNRLFSSSGAVCVVV